MLGGGEGETSWPSCLVFQQHLLRQGTFPALLVKYLAVELSRLLSFPCRFQGPFHGSPDDRKHCTTGGQETLKIFAIIA